MCYRGCNSVCYTCGFLEVKKSVSGFIRYETCCIFFLPLASCCYTVAHGTRSADYNHSTTSKHSESASNTLFEAKRKRGLTAIATHGRESVSRSEKRSHTSHPILALNTWCVTRYNTVCNTVCNTMLACRPHRTMHLHLPRRAGRSKRLLHLLNRVSTVRMVRWWVWQVCGDDVGPGRARVRRQAGIAPAQRWVGLCRQSAGARGGAHRLERRRQLAAMSTPQTKRLPTCQKRATWIPARV